MSSWPKAFFVWANRRLTSSFFGDVRLDCYGFAAAGGNLGDDLFRASLAGGVINDHGGAFRRELFGDGGTDAFGGPVTTATLPASFFELVFEFMLIISLCLICHSPPANA